jgi:hypothetical protein
MALDVARAVVALVRAEEQAAIERNVFRLTVRAGGVGWWGWES